MSDEPAAGPAKAPVLRLDRFLGPPAAFRKALLAFACFFVACYMFVSPEAAPPAARAVASLTRIAITTTSLLTAFVFTLLSMYDLRRNVSLKASNDSILAVLTFLLGFVLLDVLRRLAVQDEEAFLEMFGTTLVGLLVALAVESKAFRNGRERS